MTLASSMPSSLPSEQSDLLRLLAYVYLQHGKAGQAAVLFQAIHLLEPDDSGITRSLACALLRDNQPGEALALLDELLLHGDITALTELLRGQALARLGRSDEASTAMHHFVHLRLLKSELQPELKSGRKPGPWPGPGATPVPDTRGH